jgi:hypothetical protein
MWLKSGEEPPTRPKHILEDRKIMATIGFSVANFHVMAALPKAHMFNATDYTDVTLR